MSASSSTSARRWGWAILLLTAGISLAFNIGHALSRDVGVPKPLAVLYGVAPVLVAMMLSHLIAIQQGGRIKRLGTGAVFVAAMALSVRAISEILQPLAGQWGYVFAGMLDLSSLLALNEILTSGTADRHTDTADDGEIASGAATTPSPPAATSPPAPSKIGGLAHAARPPFPPSGTAIPPATDNTPAPPPKPPVRLQKTAPHGGAGPNGSPRTTNSQPNERQHSRQTAAPPTPPPATPPPATSEPATSEPATSEPATSEPASSEPASAPTADRAGLNAGDWRTALRTDVAAAAAAFVRERDAAGLPPRGAGAEFARQAHEAGSDLSARQLRAYVLEARRQLQDQIT